MNKEQLIKSKQDFLQLAPDGIHWGINYHFKKESDGSYSFYIPSFDLYYSAPTLEKGDARAASMTKSFMNYWLGNQGFRSFILQILKLGFKTPTYQETQQLLKRTNLNARLKFPNRELPPEFENTETADQENSLAIAI